MNTYTIEKKTVNNQNLLVFFSGYGIHEFILYVPDNQIGRVNKMNNTTRFNLFLSYPESPYYLHIRDADGFTNFKIEISIAQYELLAEKNISIL